MGEEEGATVSRLEEVVGRCRCKGAGLEEGKSPVNYLAKSSIDLFSLSVVSQANSDSKIKAKPALPF